MLFVSLRPLKLSVTLFAVRFFGEHDVTPDSLVLVLLAILHAGRRRRELVVLTALRVSWRSCLGERLEVDGDLPDQAVDESLF